jgi:hypothetical protein
MAGATAATRTGVVLRYSLSSSRLRPDTMHTELSGSPVRLFSSASTSLLGGMASEQPRSVVSVPS